MITLVEIKAVWCSESGKWFRAGERYRSFAKPLPDGEFSYMKDADHLNHTEILQIIHRMQESEGVLHQILGLTKRLLSC